MTTKKDGDPVEDKLVDIPTPAENRGVFNAIYNEVCPSCGRKSGFICTTVWDPDTRTSESFIYDKVHLARVKKARVTLSHEDLAEPFVRITM